MTLKTAILAALGLLLVFVVASVLLGLLRALSVPAYWRARAAEVVPEGALRIVALGDSAMQAIGADRPEEGIAGRIASYLEQCGGRPVQLTNVSQSGATVAQVRSRRSSYPTPTCSTRISFLS